MSILTANVNNNFIIDFTKIYSLTEYTLETLQKMKRIGNKENNLNVKMAITIRITN